MARQARIDGAGVRHHITSHLIPELGKLTDHELDIFETAVEQASKRFPVRLHAYCIMRTHIHLAVECETPSISAFMKLTLQLCAQRLNKLRKRRGPVFDRRFFNQVIETDSQWMSLVTYIHLNPVHAMHHEPTAHRWSSARAYAHPTDQPDWLVTEEFIAAFGSRTALVNYTKQTKRRRLRDKEPKRPHSRRPVFGPDSETDVWPLDFRRPDRRRKLKQSLE